MQVFLSVILTTSSKLNFLRRKNSEPQKSRVRKSSQDSGLSSRGRAPAVTRNLRTTERTERTEVKRSAGSDLSKSSSISNLSQVRPRSTSLTRSQSQRLGPGSAGGRLSSAGRASSDRLVRPRSSTINSSCTNNNSKGGWISTKLLEETCMLNNSIPIWSLLSVCFYGAFGNPYYSKYIRLK